MKISYKSIPVTFGDLNPGDVFLVIGYSNVYMKIEECLDKCNKIIRNAIILEDGAVAEVGNTKPVIKLDATLEFTKL